jgi:hypothetical protein
MEFKVCQCARFVKLRSQVIPTPSQQMQASSISVFDEVLLVQAWRISVSRATCRTTIMSRLTLLAIVILFAGCSKSAKPSYQTFASPDDAGNGLLTAAKSGDPNTIIAVFGPESKDIVVTGDPVQDKNTADLFISEYGAMHRWRKMPDQSQTLLMGADNFPFPIPLKKNAAGQWYFDVAAGRAEILVRRIGRNELDIMDVCMALADAQAEYFSERHDDGGSHEFAMKFISDTGKQNGLYWEAPEGQPKSPLGPLAAFATNEGYSLKPDSHVPFHGYYFHMLTRQGGNVPGGAKDYVVDGKLVGGFAFVAYPAEYRNSGVMTFIINQDGVLLQKDLGTATAQTAAAMTEFNPDPSWTQAVEQ